ncbi:TlpA family protein disulfide reductase [Sphingomonas sp. ac-8]|uniref:TlpA family protein disulfide reductase n=1 Tax=Sphingomonas sp. ac-8 TaxID=3242977 RepID=UPI003A7F685F
MVANIEFPPRAYKSMGQTAVSIAFFRRLLRRARTLLWPIVLLAGPAAAQTPAYPSETVLLFVAGWCAPCMAELQRLPEITSAARPYRVLVVPIDEGRRVERMLQLVPKDQRWRPSGTAWQQVQAGLLSGSAGLPYSVAIDGERRPCADSRRGLDAKRAAVLVAECRAIR